MFVRGTFTFVFFSACQSLFEIHFLWILWSRAELLKSKVPPTSKDMFLTMLLFNPSRTRSCSTWCRHFRHGLEESLGRLNWAFSAQLSCLSSNHFGLGRWFPSRKTKPSDQVMGSCSSIFASLFSDTNMQDCAFMIHLHNGEVQMMPGASKDGGT